MEPRERIIVALDVDDVLKAAGLAEKLRPYVGSFKIGLQLALSILRDCINPLAGQGNSHMRNIQILFRILAGDIFMDLKLNDIPNTVAGASGAIAQMGVRMFNVHCLGGRKMMEEARRAVKETLGNLSSDNTTKGPLILGVTVLTSLDFEALKEIGLITQTWLNQYLSVTDDIKRIMIEEIVVRLALLAKSSGLDGVVASPKKITAIRKACGKDFLIVTPGVRPEWAALADQKRVMTPREAVKAGADYLVIGRPITSPPPEIGGPVEAAKRILAEIS